MIEFRKVCKAYNGNRVINDISFLMAPGERCVIFGPSGCGKTSILRLIAGLIAPDSGTIRVKEQVVSQDGKIVIEPDARNVGMVFQDLALWPHMHVSENLEFPLKFKGFTEKDIKQRLSETLEMLQLQENADRLPGELSGGEQQRVALGRALISRPQILLMDEPLSNLDYELNLDMRRQILKMQEQSRLTLVYVTHSVEEALDLGQTVIVMQRGKVRFLVSTEEARQYFERLRGKSEITGGERP